MEIGYGFFRSLDLTIPGVINSFRVIIFERPDRAYSTTYWKDMFNNSYMLNLPIVCSDHSPIILVVQEQIKLRGKPYK